MSHLVLPAVGNAFSTECGITLAYLAACTFQYLDESRDVGTDNSHLFASLLVTFIIFFFEN